MADKPTVEWDEGNPSGSQEKSLGGLRMREMRTQLREIIGEDHKLDSSGQGATWGYHNRLTCYVQASDPIPDANTGDLYAKDDTSKAEAFWVDEDDNVVQLTKGGNFISGMIGEIRIWKGALADIPIGWALCDGTGGTPNLVGKFIRGVNTDATDPGGTGGADTVTITTSIMPAHTHTATSLSDSTAHSHSMTYYLNEVSGKGSTTTPSAYFSSESGYTYNSDTDAGTSLHGGHSGTSGNISGGSAINNRPAFVENMFIVKT